MKRRTRGPVAVRVVVIAMLALLCGSRAETQDPKLDPTYGTVTLTAGFTPDPYSAKLEAGGPIQTNLGGVGAWVAQKPDFKLHYTAGQFPLTIHVTSEADTTLLINLPDGTWIANDDGPNNGLNPLLKFAKPQTGRYDIWVGTLNKGATPPAKLYITEVK